MDYCVVCACCEICFSLYDRVAFLKLVGTTLLSVTIKGNSDCTSNLVRHRLGSYYMGNSEDGKSCKLEKPSSPAAVSKFDNDYWFSACEAFDFLDP